MPDAFPTRSDLIAIAAIIIAFAAAVIIFRIQREVSVQEKNQWEGWIPWAEHLVLASFVLAVFALFTLLTFKFQTAIATASCVSALFLLVGYVPAILAHYRIFFGTQRNDKDRLREQGEPLEKVFVILTATLAASAFAFVYWRQH